MNYQKFARIYSYSRISRYLKASKGNKKKAQQMYSTMTQEALDNVQAEIAKTEAIMENGDGRNNQ